ncbi:MAG: prenyltransferase/squalene oxidase repeat-containing protein [Pirellulales bacterium]
MNTTDLVHYFSADDSPRRAVERPALVPSHYELAAPVRNSILRARHHLIDQQRLDGSWAGRKSGDVSSLSQLVLLFTYLGREQTELVAHAARAIRRDQTSEGGWSLAPDGPLDLQASVLAYFALKLAGEDAGQPDMSRARQSIRERGGADATDAATRLWLALLGQIDYDHCPPIAPEWLLTAPLTGSLTATDERRLAAFSVVWSLRPRREVELARGVRELFVEPSRNWFAASDYLAPQPATALAGVWSWCERIGFVPLRKWALDRANLLLAEPAAETACGDADFRDLAWQWIALAALGYRQETPAIAACEGRMERLIAVDVQADEARSQPETSLTADTALAIEALHASGVGVDEPPVAAGLKWLIDHRVSPACQSNSAREMAAVQRALARLHDGDDPPDVALPPNLQLATRRSQRSTQRSKLPAILLRQLGEDLYQEFHARQRPDGGWSPWGWSSGGGADVNCRSRGVIRASARQSDDESAPDATGAMLELLSFQDRDLIVPMIRRADAFLRSVQRGDGSWHSAAGVRLIHGTTWAVRGLIAAGAAADDPVVAAGVNWLLVHQQESGGWGEAVVGDASERDFVAAEPTAIQTAWAVLALLAAGHADHDATRHGVEFLVAAQLEDGRWCDAQLTERDSAAGAWYRNDLHSDALPLLALARWAVAIGQHHDATPTNLRLVRDDTPN